MLDKSFYTRDAITVAKELLGKKICCNDREAIIIETEAYTISDPGSHAYKKKTKRNSVMYDEGGVLYIYLCYGMHELMNIVTDKEGMPSAVLIRAVEPVKGIKGKTNGPGLVTKALGITREHNGMSLTSKELWIEKGIKPEEIIQTTRIGLSQGGGLPYRFYIKDNPLVSKK